MDENLKNELAEIVHTQPRKRLERWVMMFFILSCILASAGGIHWLTDKTNSQNEVKEMMQSGFGNIHKEIRGVKSDISVIKNDISDIKTEQSEQRQFNKVVKNGFTKRDKIQTEQIEEIYNQMKRDQSPKDRDASEESYIPLDRIEGELTYVKKKLNQQSSWIR